MLGLTEASFVISFFSSVSYLFPRNGTLSLLGKCASDGRARITALKAMQQLNHWSEKFLLYFLAPPQVTVALDAQAFVPSIHRTMLRFIFESVQVVTLIEKTR